MPALVYVAFNLDSGALSGWGIPMATDIAFALGILAVFGSRAPLGLKVFLTALAIADDIGADGYASFVCAPEDLVEIVAWLRDESPVNLRLPQPGSSCMLEAM